MYLYRECFYFQVILFYVQLNHTSLAVDGFLLVKDEVADAVVDVFTLVGLNGLQGVGMVAYQHIGTRIDELAGLQSLSRHGLHGVFTTPVE